jgi:large subunit ribosomal protein L23
LDIKLAVTTIFGKKVTQVRTCNYAGKARRRGAQKGRTNHWKKAIVRLAEGEKIDLV